MYVFYALQMVDGSFHTLGQDYESALEKLYKRDDTLALCEEHRKLNDFNMCTRFELVERKTLITK